MNWYKILIRGISVISCLFLISCNVTIGEVKTVTISARLLNIISGQTIEVMIPERDDLPHRVRIIGINVPRSEDDFWSKQAKIRLQELMTASKLKLELESTESDRYDRILAHVWQNDTLLAEELAKEGYVLANNKYPHKYSDRIFYGQEYARILGYGIWK